MIVNKIAFIVEVLSFGCILLLSSKENIGDGAAFNVSFARQYCWLKIAKDIVYPAVQRIRLPKPKLHGEPNAEDIFVARHIANASFGLAPGVSLNLLYVAISLLVSAEVFDEWEMAVSKLLAFSW